MEEAKTLQARCFLQSNLFDEYDFTPDPEEEEGSEFNINFSILLECLNIFGSSGNTALKLSYEGYGTPLSLMYAKEFRAPSSLCN